MKKIHNSIRSAVDFLAAARNEEGLWGDFPSAGGSDEWVTLYIGTVLAGSSDPMARSMALEAWNRIAPRNFPSGYSGWAFSSHHPGDADSTAWGIKLAIRLGLTDTLRVKAAVHFLEKHLASDGGLATFSLESAFDKLSRTHPGYDVTGWTSSHLCTTAAAAIIPSMNGKLVPYLLKHQRSDGGWSAYWTADEIYTVAYAAEALRMNGNPACDAALRKARQWVEKAFGDHDFIATDAFPSGSPFATALGLRSLVITCGQQPGFGRCDKTARWLQARQQENGSWQASTRMLIPDPHIRPCVTSDGSEPAQRTPVPIKPDRLAFFTTATVVDSLILYETQTTDR